MSTEQLRAALYIRVSTEDQDEYSPDAQRKALIEYAKKNDLEVMTNYIYEDAESGRSTKKRQRFMDMLNDAKQKPKPFDVVLVHRLDRFARSKEDSVVCKVMLRKAGIKVMSATEPLGDDKFSIILESMLEAMAEYFSLNLEDEVRKGMHEKALRGGVLGMAPLGYRVKPKLDKDETSIFEIVPEEAVYIRYIFEQFTEHGTEINIITRKLNDMGCRTKKGNPIGRFEVTYILNNPAYIGMSRWTPSGRNAHGLPLEDTIIASTGHKAIISEEQFQKAATKLAEMRRTAKPSGRPYSEYSHWLSGLLKCSNCGSTLTYKPDDTSPGFQCRGYGNAKCNISHSISVRKIERAILGELKAALDNDAIVGFKLNVKRERVTDVVNDELTIKETQLKKLAERLERASDAYLAGVYTLDEYKRKREEMEQEQARLTEEIEALKASPPPETAEATSTKFKEKVKDVLEVLTSEDYELGVKVKAIRTIVDMIVFDKPNKTIKVYYYGM